MVIYDAQNQREAELLSSLHPSAVGIGGFTAKQNFRSDHGGMLVRGGTSQIIGAPIAGATVVDWWTGELNGTNYIVAGFNVTDAYSAISEVRLYMTQSISGTIQPWQEITEVGYYSGNALGDSRFPTQTGRLTFAAFKAPQGLMNGTVLSARDVLMIGDGTNANRLWDPIGINPGQLTITGIANGTGGNAGLIQITISSDHFLNASGDTINISDVVESSSTGIIVNGTWEIIKVSTTAVCLVGSVWKAGATFSSDGYMNIPMQLTLHQPVITPNGADAFSSLQTLSKYFTFPGAASLTYYSGAANKTVVVTSGTTYTIPSDWTNTNTIRAIGPGASGSGTHGGGGGGYAQVVNESGHSASDSITIRIGTNASGLSTKWSTTVEAGAASGTTAGTGITGSTKHSGGAGNTYVHGGGGGGAGGYNGAGATGNNGNGGQGDSTHGGLGGHYGVTNGTDGGNGSEYNLFAGGSAGPGGGGGGGQKGVAGNGGLYGGGGGGSENGTNGVGADGALIITYASASASNASSFKLENSDVAPYSSSDNLMMQLLWTSSATAGQVATVYLPEALDLGSGLVIVTEDNQSSWGIADILAYTKIQVNADNTTYDMINEASYPWQTIYDPSNLDPAYQAFVGGATNGSLIPVPAEVTDTTVRQMNYFPIPNYTPGTANPIYHIRFVILEGAPAPGTTSKIIFLALGGGGAFPALGDWSVTYEDIYGRSESPSFTAPNTNTATITQIGGPLRYSSTAAAQFTLPPFAGFMYDYQLNAATPSASSITGGLQGQPSHMNFYLHYENEQTNGFYTFNWELYAQELASPLIWVSQNINAGTITINSWDPSLGNLNTDSRNFFRVVPSDFVIAVPPAKALTYANSRLFACNVTDPNSGAVAAGDGYFSEQDNPFRMSSVVESDSSGGRFSLDHERIESAISGASGVDGRTFVYLVGGHWLYSLGSTGNLEGSGYIAADLTIAFRLLHRGTNAFRTVLISPDGAIFYADTTGQITRYFQGLSQPITQFRTDDKLANIPAARRVDACACFFNNRYYMPYTVASGTTNTRILGYHDVIGKFEFDDAPPFDCERILSFYDSSYGGSGQRLFFISQAGIIYEYEVAGAQDNGSDIAVHLTTGELQAGGTENAVEMPVVYVDADPQTNDNILTALRIYRNPAGQYSTTLDMTNGWVHDAALAMTEVSAPADGGGGRARTVQLDLSGTLQTGTRIYNVQADLKGQTGREAK